MRGVTPASCALSLATRKLINGVWSCRRQRSILQDVCIAMIERMPRIAYFPDSFHEVNSVAHTSRHFEAFARRRNLPFLCVRAGVEGRAPVCREEGNVWSLEL